MFKAEDEILEKRDAIIESLDPWLAKHNSADALFTIRWR